MKKAAVIVLTVFLLTFISACTATPSENPVPPGTNQSNETDQPVNDTPATYGVGDSAELGGWSFTLDAFEFMEKVDGDFNSYAAPDEGCQFGVVSLSVTNSDTSAAVFLPTFSTSNDVRAKIMCGEYEFSATNLLAHSNDLHDETINPLVTVSGIIAFNIPQSVVDGSDTLTFVLTQGDDTLVFTLR